VRLTPVIALFHYNVDAVCLIHVIYLRPTKVMKELKLQTADS
jgi:hypothetical protein